MGGRGSSAAGSQGIRMPAAQPAPPPQTRTQQLMAQVAADPTALASMSDTDAQTVVQEVARMPVLHDGTQEDSFMQRWLNHIGFTSGKPRVLDERSFNAAARNSGATVLYHADSSISNRSSTAMAQQLLTGPTMYAAGGIYGDGTYWATSATGSAMYGRNAGTQVKGFISKTRGRVATPTSPSTPYAPVSPRGRARAGRARRPPGRATLSQDTTRQSRMSPSASMASAPWRRPRACGRPTRTAPRPARRARL